MGTRISAFKYALKKSQNSIYTLVAFLLGILFVAHVSLWTPACTNTYTEDNSLIVELKSVCVAYKISYDNSNFDFEIKAHKFSKKLN